MIRFPSHVFAVAIGEHVIVFDSINDRYVALPGAASSSGDNLIDVGLVGVCLVPEAAAILVEAGLLEDGRPTTCGSIDKPSSTLVIQRDATVGVRLLDIPRFVAALTLSSWKLRHGIGCRAFSQIRRPYAGSVSELADPLARLCRARLIVPSPRRCLPRSLLAAHFLCDLGHTVDVVLGVRAHPFEAHSWIEAGGVVLDDDLDRVRAFTPIAVGRS